MSLNGWDVVSVVATSVINKSLRDNTQKLCTKFKYREEGLRISGTFGAWQIAPGGSPRKLIVDLPIENGTMRTSVWRKDRHSLKGMTLRVELALRLLPAPIEGGARELVFDLDRTDGLGAEIPVTAIDLIDPADRLSSEDARVLMITLAACLTNHADQVSFVFASVGALQGGVFATEHQDWAYLEAEGGGEFLALVGAIHPPSENMSADTISPAIFTKDTRASLAISGRALCELVLGPWLNENFRPKARFSANGERVRLQSPCRLPVQSRDGFRLKPVLRELLITKTERGFKFDIGAITDVEGQSVRLHTKLQMTMKFAVDNAAGTVKLVQDQKPQSKTWAEGTGFWGSLIQFIANIVLLFMQDQLAATVNGIAAGMIKLNTPTAQPVTWAGLPDFKATKITTDGFLLYRDLHLGHFDRRNTGSSNGVVPRGPALAG